MCVSLFQTIVFHVSSPFIVSLFQTIVFHVSSPFLVSLFQTIVLECQKEDGSWPRATTQASYQATHSTRSQDSITGSTSSRWAWLGGVACSYMDNLELQFTKGHYSFMGSEMHVLLNFCETQLPV